MAFSTIDNRKKKSGKLGKIATYLAALLQRNAEPEVLADPVEAPQELNIRYFYEREHPADLAQAQRDVNRIWC